VVPIIARVRDRARPALFPALTRSDAGRGPAPTKTKDIGATRAHIILAARARTPSGPAGEHE